MKQRPYAYFRNQARARQAFAAYDRAVEILAARRAMFGDNDFLFPEAFRPSARARATRARAGTARRPRRRSERARAVLLAEMENIAVWGAVEGRDRNEVLRLQMAQADRENRAAAHRARVRRHGL